MTDAETTAAIDALARRIRLRDAAMRDGSDYADADVFALEAITALLGHGWRRVPALTPPKPAVPAKPGSRREELLGPLRAHLDALNAPKRADAKEGAA